MKTRPVARWTRFATPHAGLALLAALVACSGESTPTIEHARIQAPPPGITVAAGYFHVRNPGSSDVAVSVLGSPGFDSVELHQTTTADGISRMRSLDSLNVPARGEAVLEPGGTHLMLFGPRQDLLTSGEVTVRLQITAADGAVTPLDVRFTVDSAEGHEQHAH